MEVAEELSALKLEAASKPLTESLAYGEVVEMPRLPLESIIRAGMVLVAKASEEVAI